MSVFQIIRPNVLVFVVVASVCAIASVSRAEEAQSNVLQAGGNAQETPPGTKVKIKPGGIPGQPVPGTIPEGVFPRLIDFVCKNDDPVVSNWLSDKEHSNEIGANSCSHPDKAEDIKSALTKEVGVPGDVQPGTIRDRVEGLLAAMNEN